MELSDRNRNLNRGFRKLRVWQEAINLYVFVSGKLATIKDIPYKVKSQIEDSAISVSSNSAGGYSRRSIKETIRFNNIALSSLSENYTQIFAQVKLKRITEGWFDEYDRMHYSLENKLLSLNKTQIKRLKEGVEWNDDYINYE